MNIKLVHLLFNPNNTSGIDDESWSSVLDKQKKSIDCFEKIKYKFSSYSQLFSNVNRSELPIDSCAAPNLVTTNISEWGDGPVLSYGHYGCYKAHRRAITQEFSDEYDAIIIIEADVITDLTPDEFYNSVVSVYNISKINDVKLVSFAGPKFGTTTYNVNDYIEVWDEEWLKVPHFLLTSTYMIMKSEKDNIKHKLETTGWHTPDIWLYWNYDRRCNILVSKKPIVYQCDGFSTLDYSFKNKW